MSGDSEFGQWTSIFDIYQVSSAEDTLSANFTYPWSGNETFIDRNYTVADQDDRYANYGPPCQLRLTTRHIILIVCFTIIFTLSVIGNCLVIVTIAQNRWMRTVTNIFLQSLAISDLLLSVICMPPTLTAMLFQCFLWGQAMCKIIMYLQPVSVAASAYTLVAIALERYNAICRPLHSRHWKTKSHAVKMIVAVWVISLLCSSPSLFMYNLVEIRPGQWNCRDDSGGAGAITGFYILFLFLVLFIVPLVLMIGLYAAVTYTLWMGIKLDTSTTTGEMSSPTDEHSPARSSASSVRQRLASTKPVKAIRHFGRSLRRTADGNTVVLVNRGSSGVLDELQKSTAKSTLTNSSAHVVESKQSTSTGPEWRMAGAGAGPVLRSTHSAKNLEAKKRVIIMLFVIVAEFLICWSPIYAYQTLFQLRYIRYFDAYLYTFLVVLSYLSSCSNPITYCFLNLKFRQAFLLAFGCRFLVKDAPVLYQNTTAMRRHNQNFQATTSRRQPGTAVANGSKHDSDAHGQSHHDRAINSLVVQCHEPEQTFAIPLLQLRTPSFRSSSAEPSGSKSRHDEVYDTDEDDDLIVSTPPKVDNGVKGKVSPSPSTPIGNGNPDFSRAKLDGRYSTPSPSRMTASEQEKLTSV